MRQTGRAFIKKNLDSKSKKKLLKAIDSYLRFQKKLSFSEYKIDDLAMDVQRGRIQSLKGIGESTNEKLKRSLRDQGYL